MSRFCGLILLGGIGIIVMGAYDFFIQVSASHTPTTVSVAALERSVPWNRNLIITGGQAMADDGVVYYETLNGAKVAGSEVYFIPIQDASLATYQSLTPPVLLRITSPQMENIKKAKTFDANAIHGVRMTHWDLDGKAEDLLIKRYGEAAVKSMVILEYEKEVTGVGGGLSKIFGGSVCIVAAIMVAGFTNRPRSVS